MELLDRYLQAVRFWLPTAQQQDIIAELSEDLRSQIEDKETELRRPLNDGEMENILKRCGSPILVASRYRPRTQLIGPALFPIYQFVLKLVLLWILIPVFIGIVGPAMILHSTNQWGALVQTLSSLWTALFVAAGVITLVFALLERSQAKLQLCDKWEPRSLPPLAKEAQPPTRTQTIFELVFASIGLVWLLVMPHYPFLILGPAAAFLKPAPIWHTFYLPIVLVAVAGLVLQCITLIRPQWTWFPPWARVTNTAISLGVLYFILGSALNAPSANWQPFVVADLTKDPAHYARLSAIANVSILACLASAWLGLSIAGVLQTWVGLRQVRGRFARPRDPALWRFLWR